MSVLLGHTEPGLAGSLPEQLPGQLLPVGPVFLLSVLSWDTESLDPCGKYHHGHELKGGI